MQNISSNLYYTETIYKLNEKIIKVTFLFARFIILSCYLYLYYTILFSVFFK